MQADDTCNVSHHDRRYNLRVGSGSIVNESLLMLGREGLRDVGYRHSDTISMYLHVMMVVGMMMAMMR